MLPIATGDAGTCAICQGVFMIDAARLLVLHGYARPGDGFIRGECMGRGYEPYEKSTRALVEYRPRVVAEVAGRTEWLRRLEAGEVTELKDLYWDRPFKAEETDRPTIFPGHRHWDATLKLNILDSTRRLGWIKEELARVDSWIANWSEQPYKAKPKSGASLSDTIEVGREYLVYGKRALVLAKGCALRGMRRHASYSGIKVKRIADGQEFIVAARTVKPLVES